MAPLRHREYRRLWAASVVGDLGDAVGRIALTILVQRETGSALYTGAVIAAFALPFLGPAQWLTGRVAHLDRRVLLVTADVFRALIFVAIAMPIGVWPRLVLVALSSLATPAYDGTLGALLPRSLPARMVPLGIGLRTASTEAAFVVGFAAGGLLADAVNPSAVILLNALSFLVSAVVLRGLTIGEAPVADDGFTRAGSAVRSILADVPTRTALGLSGVAFATALVPETLVATYVDEVFPDTTGLAGALAAVVAVGVIVTTMLRRPERHGAVVRHAAVITTVGGLAMAAAFAGPDTIPIAFLAYIGIGPVLAIRVHAMTLITERIPDGQLASAMSVAAGVLMASHVVAGLGGGLVAEAVGMDSAATLAGGATAVVGAAVWLRCRRAVEVRPAATG